MDDLPVLISKCYPCDIHCELIDGLYIGQYSARYINYSITVQLYLKQVLVRICLGDFGPAVKLDVCVCVCVCVCVLSLIHI